jgi:hypothetical protein
LWLRETEYIFMDKIYGFDPNYKPLWVDDPSVLGRP